MDEVEFREFFAAAVEPCVETPAVGEVRVEGFGDDEPERLDAAVDFREVAAWDETAGVEPWDFAADEGVETIEAVGELIAGQLDLGGVEEFVVAEGPVDGLVEDLDVGEEREGRAVFESGAGGLDGVGELGGLFS